MPHKADLAPSWYVIWCSHVSPAIISQESHFLGDNIATLPSNVRQTRPLASQPVSFYQEEIHPFHGSASQCIDPPKRPSLPRHERNFSHAISNCTTLCSNAFPEAANLALKIRTQARPGRTVRTWRLIFAHIQSAWNYQKRFIVNGER